MARSGEAARAVNGRGAGFRPLRQPGDVGSRVAAITADNDAQWLDALRGALQAGIAVLFSPTSDGGAISVTVYEGDDRLRSYASDADEFDALLGAIRDRVAARGV